MEDFQQLKKTAHLSSPVVGIFTYKQIDSYLFLLLFLENI